MPGGYKSAPAGWVTWTHNQTSIAADATINWRCPVAGKIIAVTAYSTTKGDVTYKVTNGGSDVFTAKALPGDAAGETLTIGTTGWANTVVAKNALLTIVYDYTASAAANVGVTVWIRPEGQVAVSSSLD